MLYLELHRRTQKLSFEGLIITKERVEKSVVLTADVCDRSASVYVIAQHAAVLLRRQSRTSLRKRISSSTGETLGRGASCPTNGHGSPSNAASATFDSLTPARVLPSLRNSSTRTAYLPPPGLHISRQKYPSAVKMQGSRATPHR
jgi:hypothetical protein